MGQNCSSSQSLEVFFVHNEIRVLFIQAGKKKIIKRRQNIHKKYSKYSVVIEGNKKQQQQQQTWHRQESAIKFNTVENMRGQKFKFMSFIQKYINYIFNFRIESL